MRKKNIQQYKSDINNLSQFSRIRHPTKEQLKAIYAKLHTLEYDIKILNALLSSSQKSTAKKESLTVLTT
jgi:uncharacterized protein (UPF0335 family)